ncbi:YoaK family protein [Camelimonas abortus]|uniref:YoaK family protein n=1 Tax=Camelimonas abortus TaxID=1017184 RepID=A0ABV7LBL3_9HYPH
MNLPSPVDRLPVPAQIALLALQVALAGYVDGIGWLLLGGVFVSFMSGNTTQLAVALASGQHSWAAQVGCALGAFFAGVFFGAVMRERSRTRSHALLFAIAAMVLAVSLVMVREFGVNTLHLLPLAFAMGLLNNARRVVNGAAVGGTFVTGAFVGFAQGAARWLLRKAPAAEFIPYALSWLALCCGALAGVMALIHAGDDVALVTPIIWAGALAIVHQIIAMRR